MVGVYFSIFFRLLKIEKFTKFSFHGLVKNTPKGPQWDRTTPSKGSLKILRRTHPKDELISSICYLPRARKTRKEYSSIWLGDLEKKYWMYLGSSRSWTRHPPSHLCQVLGKSIDSFGHSLLEFGSVIFHWVNAASVSCHLFKRSSTKCRSHIPPSPVDSLLWVL